MLAIIEIWNSDGNAIVREKLRRLTVSRMVPLLSTVIEQGIDEGVFRVASPDESATVFVSLLLGFQELANEYFIARQAGTITFEAVQRSVASFTEAFERILGIAHIEVFAQDATTPHLEIFGMPASRDLFEQLRDSIEIQRHARNVYGVVS